MSENSAAAIREICTYCCCSAVLQQMQIYENLVVELCFGFFVNAFTR